MERQLQRLRSSTIDGANVTVPHKQLAFELADEVHPTARRVGVANVLAHAADGRVVAYNTDASALGEELVRSVTDAGVDVSERPYALVLGNGGASKAAVVACQLAGIERVLVCARKFDVDVDRSEWPEAGAFTALGARLVAWPRVGALGGQELSEFLPEAHLIVQATSAGMKGAPGGETLAEAIPWDSFSKGVVYDLVYNPRRTPFLAKAEREGHHAVGGLGMLVGQASDAIGIWLGRTPALAPLLRSAQEALDS